MKVLSTFSGIGCYDFGLQCAGYEIVGQIEIDEFCRAALRKHWPDVPKFKDIRNVTTKKNQASLRRN